MSGKGSAGIAHQAFSKMLVVILASGKSEFLFYFPAFLLSDHKPDSFLILFA
jgi:hypothetical protein